MKITYYTLGFRECSTKLLENVVKYYHGNQLMLYVAYVSARVLVLQYLKGATIDPISIW